TRQSEQRLELAAVRPLRGVVEREIVHVQLEAAVRPEPNELPHLVGVPRRPEGRHAHDLVLALVDLEAEKRGEGTIKQANRVRKPDLVREPQLRTLAAATAGR